MYSTIGDSAVPVVVRAGVTAEAGWTGSEVFVEHGGRRWDDGERQARGVRREICVVPRTRWYQ